jgi:hypothetical protein
MSFSHCSKYKQPHISLTTRENGIQVYKLLVSEANGLEYRVCKLKGRKGHSLESRTSRINT